MAAGLGFKDFVTGEVLTAADVDGYLMQGTWVFASAAARSAAVTSPQEGNMSYLKDTNSTEYYSGSAWVPVAGAGGGITLISTTTLTGAGVSLTSIPTTYTNLRFVIKGYYASSADFLYMRFNNDTGGGYYANAENFDSTASFSTPTGASALGIIKAYNTSGDTYLSYAEGYIPNYTETTGGQFMHGQGYGGDTRKGWNFSGVYSNRSAAITQIDLFQGAGNLTAGTIYLYGEK
jgi:hypothetical protein